MRDSECAPHLDLVEALRDPVILSFVNGVLDRRDLKGRFPQRFSSREQEFIRRVESVFPRKSLRPLSSNRVTVNLDSVAGILREEARDRGLEMPDLEHLFDLAANRSLLDQRAAVAALGQRILSAIDEGIAIGRQRAETLGSGHDDSAWVDWGESLRAEVIETRGPSWGLFRAKGKDELVSHIARISAAFLIARDPRREPLRLDDLSRAAAGDTKVFRPDTKDLRALVVLLSEANAELRDRITTLAPPGSSLFRRLFLEELGILVNDTPVDVVVQGALEYQIAGESLAYPAQLARHGLSAKITLGALRRADAISTPCQRVISVENESAFHQLARRFPDSLLVFTQGQASWAVVHLLQRLGVTGPHITFHHSGDLDRSGLIILSSLCRRTGLDIKPLWMTQTVHQCCRERGLPMRREELRQTRRLLENWNHAWGQDLLETLIETGRWVEEEEVVARDLPWPAA